MLDTANLITRDSFDFRQYMNASDPLVNVANARAWKHELMAVLEHGQHIQGTRLPWTKTHDLLRFGGGEVTLWQGYNGHGKSQLLGQAAMWFAAQGERVCVASFEMQPVKTLLRMLRQFAMNGNPGKQAASKMMQWCKDKFWLYDQLGSVKPEILYAVIRYCAIELGIKHFVVDSLMKCVEGEDDYNGQKNFIDMLTALAREYSIHIHVVHHVRKSEDEDKVPGKLDAKGSGAITDLVDQILTVWRNKKKEGAIERAAFAGDAVPEQVQNQPDALLVCSKNRHGEWEGSIKLWFHAPSLQYTADQRNIPVAVDGASKWEARHA